jgi:nucleoside-diphosphate-sugar epimerase
VRNRKKHTILIAGASGVVGKAATEHFAAQPDFEVLALSRRSFALPDGVIHVPLDLTDRAACLAAADNLADVTHVLYAALFELPQLVAGWRDERQMKTNEAMLRNLLDALQGTAKGLRHVTIMQGTKAYGGHVEPAPVPAKERRPRHNHANFYWLQEDMLRERQPNAAWTFSILRPQLVFGYAVSSPMNIVGAIGAYAAVMRELDQPLSFPGGGRYINAASDARLIAQAAHFCATHEVAANETYNVVNGDMLVWQDLWGSIAKRFGMQAGPPSPMSLTDVMPSREDVWRRVVDRHDLQRLTLEQMIGSSWQFTDRAFAHGIEQPAHSVLSPIKLHQHGFHGCMDTEDSLHDWLEKMQRDRLLPR